MKHYPSIGALPLGGPRRTIAIGTFDGVHLGHREIIGTAVREAGARGLLSMVVTFEPHPIAVLRPELTPTVLTPPAFKASLIATLGVDELLVVPFTRAFSRVRAERFAEMLMGPPIGADVVVVGDNFRFGHRGAGTVQLLRQLGRSRGLEVVIPEIVQSPDGKPISSTRVRRLIAQGDVAAAAALLARPHAVDGVVVPGDQRGRALGYPTANLEVPAGLAVPGKGVYAAVARDGAERHAAAVNIGVSPTFTDPRDRPPIRVEAFLIDYAGPDLYGRTLRLEFLGRLRDEQRFASVDELVAQMGRDVDRTRELVAEALA